MPGPHAFTPASRESAKVARRLLRSGRPRQNLEEPVTILRRLCAACALLPLAAASHAVPLAGDGQWTTFDVDSFSSASGGVEWIDLFDGGAPISFDFSVPTGWRATLTVVDGGFAGDRFRVTDAGAVLGDTSVPGSSYPDSIGLDFDAALADPAYSSGLYTLGAGDHRIGGYLIASVAVDGVALDATVGAVRLTVSPVPEPATAMLLLAGFALIGAYVRLRGH
jgi:hypothetical protein